MNLLNEGWIWWAAALAIGVPIVLVALTELLGALTRRNHPAAGPVRLTRNWIVPVGALLALLAFAFQSPEDQVWVRVVATVLGFLVILLVLSSFNVALFANAKTGTWRERIPTIFIEIARLILVLVGLAVLFQWVWNADVGGLIAALGVGSIVIGLALQNAVGGVISGLLLLFEQPFRIGDWLAVGDVKGRVVEVNWRAVHIDTGKGLQVLPNSTLSGASFTNLSRPEGTFHASANVTFTTDDPPHEVIALLVEVAESLPMRVANERASAQYRGAGEYSVSLPVNGPSQGGAALSLYLAWLWYAARRRGLALDGDSTDPIAEPQQLAAAVSFIGPTLHLGDKDRELILEEAHLERYGSGEVIFESGVVPQSVLFVVDGTVRVSVEARDARIDFATVEPGDYVGQTALTREPTITTSTAADVVTVLVVPLATLDRLVSTRPRLAREIGQSIELKRTSATEALAAAGVTRALTGGI